MQSSISKKNYQFGLNLIILIILAVVLLSTPLVLWLGLFKRTLASNDVGNVPDFLITIEYIFLIILLPLLFLVLYFPIIKLLTKRFRALKNIKEFSLPLEFNVKDSVIMSSLVALVVIIALVSNTKTFLYFSCVSILVVALRIFLILDEFKKVTNNPSRDSRLIEKKLKLIRNWVRFLMVIAIIMLVVLLRILVQKI